LDPSTNSALPSSACGRARLLVKGVKHDRHYPELPLRGSRHRLDSTGGSHAPGRTIQPAPANRQRQLPTSTPTTVGKLSQEIGAPNEIPAV